MNWATQIAARVAKTASSVICRLVPPVFQPPHAKPMIIAMTAPQIRPQTPNLTLPAVSGFIEQPPLKCGGSLLHALCESGIPPPSEQPRHPQHDHGTHKGDEDGPDVQPRHAGAPNVVEEPGPRDGADDTDHQISKDAPGSLTRNHPLRHPACDDPDDNPCHDTHRDLPSPERYR